MALEETESFGQFLKRERELREISLEEIAAYTRIKLRALEAIERDDFASLPALAFVRAFIRCYADYLGLNIADVMLQFDTFIQSRYPELTGEMPVVPKKPQPKQRFLPLIFIMVAILLAAFAYWLSRPPSSPRTTKPELQSSPPPPASRPTTLPPTAAVLAMGPSGTSSPATPPSSPPPSTSAPATLPSHTPTPPPPLRPPLPTPSSVPPTSTPSGENKPITSRSPVPRIQKIPPSPLVSTSSAPLGPPRALATMPPGKSLPPPPLKTEETPKPPTDAGPKEYKHRVKIRVKAPCWIQYIIDDDKPHNYIIQPGDKGVELSAEKKIKIKIGNPDSVLAVSYNGQPVEFKPKCFPWWVNYPSRPDDNVCP